jgi:spectrin beta
LREIKRRQEAAEAQERARREQEEAERLAALAAAQPKQPEAVPTDRPDSGTPAAEERPERGSPGDEEVFEGILTRKHEWENTTVKASVRSWDKVYAVLHGSQLSFYKDSKVARATPDQTFKGEVPLTVHKANASIAQDYKKKKHVFRLKLESGAEFLFQAHNDAEMNAWISRINAQADADSSGPSRSQTLPASAQKEDSKRRSFFTLKKK